MDAVASSYCRRPRRGGLALAGDSRLLEVPHIDVVASYVNAVVLPLVVDPVTLEVIVSCSGHVREGILSLFQLDRNQGITLGD